MATTEFQRTTDKPTTSITIPEGVERKVMHLPLWVLPILAKIDGEISTKGRITKLHVESHDHVHVTSEVTGRLRIDQLSPTETATWFMDKTIGAVFDEYPNELNIERVLGGHNSTRPSVAITTGPPSPETARTMRSVTVLTA